MACLNFTLYLDSTFPRNLWTNDIRKLTKLCQEFGGGHYSIEIVHLANERQRAFRDGVLTTPTILLEQGNGRKQILGNFQETELFLQSRKTRPVAQKVPVRSSLFSLFSSFKPSRAFSIPSLPS